MIASQHWATATRLSAATTAMRASALASKPSTSLPCSTSLAVLICLMCTAMEATSPLSLEVSLCACCLCVRAIVFICLCRLWR